ncbi:MAG: universal stress protein [Chloroflexi bacterium]|nr:universal stress protein [Chloroflexota bacterium]MCL5273403.1 universal stress protein [Chloroflexota bacterium]
MYKTILVPLDQSQRAEAIFPHVEELARCNQATVILLHVLELRSLAYEYYGIQPEMDQLLLAQMTVAARSYLDSCKQRLAAEGIAVKTRLVNGPVIESVLQVAREEGADLIAMSSHGRSGLSRVLHGSIATGILQRSGLPLLLIRSLESAPSSHDDGERVVAQEVSHANTPT